MKLKVGETLDIKIIDMSDTGSGIGKLDNLVIFVENTVLGDEVSIELTKIKKSFAIGKLKEILKPSKYRNENNEKIGLNEGADLSIMTYEGQIEWKRKTVIDKLKRLAKIENPKVNDIVSMENPTKYRNKVVLHTSTGGIITKKGGIVVGLQEPSVGFYENKTNKVVDLKDSILCDDIIKIVASTTKDFMIQDNITGYDPKWKRGLFKHIIVKFGYVTGEVMVIAVINGKGIPNCEKFINMLDEKIYSLPQNKNGVKYSLESFIINISKEDEKVDLSDENNIYMAGKHHIVDYIGETIFEISPAAFYQVNPLQTEKLYDLAFKYADIQGGENILDLYCGVGTIGIYFAKEIEKKIVDSAKTKIIGIDYEKSAILKANRNAVINYIVNAEFICGKVEEKLPELIDGNLNNIDTINSVDVVILDPPRKGCEKIVLETISKVNVKKIVYISCNPATLARDIAILVELGYKFIEATPVDMFPQTSKIECVALLEKN